MGWILVIAIAFIALLLPKPVIAEDGSNLSPSPEWMLALKASGGVATTSPKEQETKEASPPTPSEVIAQVFPDAPIMYWVAVNESELDPGAYNPSGAQGLFQIVGITWRNYGCTGDPFSALDNALCARKIYDANGLTDWRWSKYHGSQGGWAKHL